MLAPSMQQLTNIQGMQKSLQDVEPFVSDDSEPVAQALGVLDHAIAIHQSWKQQLLAAVTAKDQLDVTTIQRDDCCVLGQWIHGAGCRQIYGSSPDFVGLLKRHKEFHVVAGIVATAINGGEYANAEKMLGERTQFAYASIDVSVAIMKLKMSVAG